MSLRWDSGLYCGLWNVNLIKKDGGYRDEENFRYGITCIDVAAEVSHKRKHNKYIRDSR